MGNSLKTTKCLIAVCKCDQIVAASRIIGSNSINGDFTQTLAKVILSGGKAKIVDVNEDLRVNECTCQKSETSHA